MREPNVAMPAGELLKGGAIFAFVRHRLKAPKFGRPVAF
jgi:hypothetical protein